MPSGSEGIPVIEVSATLVHKGLSSTGADVTPPVVATELETAEKQS